MNNMTKKQRERLEELRVLMNDKGAYREGILCRILDYLGD